MKVLIPIAFALAISGTAANAADDPQFNKLDTDHNGVVDPTEAKQMPTLAKQFSTADTNRDGSLDQAEYKKAIAQSDQKQPHPGAS